MLRKYFSLLILLLFFYRLDTGYAFLGFSQGATSLALDSDGWCVKFEGDLYGDFECNDADRLLMEKLWEENSSESFLYLP